MTATLHHAAALRRVWGRSHSTREDLVAYQNAQLRRLVRHAYRHVAYYRRLFDRAGVRPRDIRTLEDLRHIPITSRRDLQALPREEVVAQTVDPRRLIVRHTNGSSGQPLSIRVTWAEERLHGALRLRALRAYGLRLTDTYCTIKLPVAQGSPLPVPLRRLLHAFGLGPQNIVSSLQSPQDLVRELHAKRPHVVSGYPSTLARVAREVDGADLRSLGLRFLCTGGEVLTPVMREQIVQAFGAPLYDWYGSHEFNLLAWQCAATGAFHSCDDGMITEILDDDRPVAEGEQGEVVGTDLISLAMPMIRYRLGDLVTKGPTTCACGQPFSTIRNIQGRRMDYFRLPGGRVLHPYELAVAAGLLRGRVPWIREYQVIQERMDRIAMRVVPFQTPSSPQIAALTTPAQALLGPAVQFHLELVPEIPFDPSGKFRVYQPLERSADGAFSATPGECR